ncbi:hypothetical protein COU61_00255 [Candidatus Pacearchaeota archaeon CG10_big_fil_rev_8_21_14_0_10_35_13]|nr:MAG: hypothetical protein COU61_00255 [Candidatus Pacearchaeota archaeon CG10_big_fil_rev_8_21_14_0_10_35_13]
MVKILIIGSMKFFDKFLVLQKDLESRGFEVRIPRPSELYGHELDIKVAANNDFISDLNWCDSVLIANYEDSSRERNVGVSVLCEVGMAFISMKKIFILHAIPEFCVDEFRAFNLVSKKSPS